ncbi:MAG: hypothetical protein IKS51_02900 [Erysipelotrichaceae bacterium]|nr:hypothetical protein [Erysipelotrichaceae bacterium]
METVVQLSKGNISSEKIRVEFNLEDMDMSGFRQGATYEEIQEWVQEKYGFHVTHQSEHYDVEIRDSEAAGKSREY